MTKFVGVYPTGMIFKFPSIRANLYNVMMMSTGLTFGTISALYGLNHYIINKDQYSIIVVVVILSAIIPTFVGQKFFYPKPEETLLEKKGGLICLSKYFWLMMGLRVQR